MLCNFCDNEALFFISEFFCDDNNGGIALCAYGFEVCKKCLD